MDALLFVDLNCRPSDVVQCVRFVRDLPFGYFVNVTSVLVRLPFAVAGYESAPLVLEELSELLNAVAPGVTSVGLLEQPFGVAAVVHGQGRLSSEADQGQRQQLLRRARAVELSAILAANHALWSPRDYHFRLPSGSHVSSFVRVADGFSDPRDVEAVATWLLPNLRDKRGMVFDNRSLTPLAIMLSRLFELAGAQPGPMSFLEHYPDSQFDVEAAVRHAASGGTGVLGVLSVSNAGRTRDGMLAALDRAGQPAWHLHVLMDRAARGDMVSDLRCNDEISTWLGFGDGADTAFPPDACPICLAQDRRRVVGIDPRFFDGMVLPDPTLIMLRPTAAQAAAPFWEAADAAQAVALEHKSATATQARRRQPEDKSARMGVFISMERLLNSADFGAKAQVAAGHLSRSSSGQSGQTGPFDGIDLVVLSRSEARADDPSHDPFIDTVKGVLEAMGCSTASIIVVDHAADPADWDADSIAAIKTSQHLLIVGAGTVTGYTMQKLLVGCQEHLRGSEDPQALTGLLLNARLATVREWQTLCNSYGLRLFTLFDTLLPTHSPLRREASTISAMRSGLNELDGDWRPRLEAFLDQRSDLCSGLRAAIDGANAAPYLPVLWGLPASDEPRAHIRQHSLFGHKLGPAAYFAAVGSAVHRERQRAAAEPGPVWHLFEMTALVRSYYDPLLIASMLRWMNPAEIWWGSSASTSVLELIERSTIEDRAVLVPELLLAASHGKLPVEAAEIVEDHAVQLLSTVPDGFGEGEIVALGAGLLAWRIDQATRGRLGRDTMDPLPRWSLAGS